MHVSENQWTRIETRALPIPLSNIYIYIYMICLSMNTIEFVWKLEHFQSMYALKPQFHVLSLITQFYPSKPAKSKSPRFTVTVSAGNSASHSRHDESTTEPQMHSTLCTYILQKPKAKAKKQIRLESARTIQITASRKDSCVHWL